MNYNQHTEDIAQALRDVLPDITWQINPTGGGCSAIQGMYFADGVLVHIVESEDGAQAPLSWLDSVTVTFKEPNYGESYPVGGYDNCADMVQRIAYDLQHEATQLTCTDCRQPMRVCRQNNAETDGYRDSLDRIRRILERCDHPELIAVLNIFEDGYLTHAIPTCDTNCRG